MINVLEGNYAIVPIKRSLSPLLHICKPVFQSNELVNGDMNGIYRVNDFSNLKNRASDFNTYVDHVEALKLMMSLEGDGYDYVELYCMDDEYTICYDDDMVRVLMDYIESTERYVHSVNIVIALDNLKKLPESDDLLDTIDFLKSELNKGYQFIFI